MEAMSDEQRVFLQMLMSKNIMDASGVKMAHRASCARFEANYDQTNLGQFVQEINRNIKPVGIEIKKGLSEFTGSSYYALVNTYDSDFLKNPHLATYTVNELELFKKIVQKIVNGDGEINTIQAVNLTDEIKTISKKRMTKKEAETLIESLSTAGWITIHKGKGIISLGTRGILELDQYISKTYPLSAINCNICKRLCIKGQMCSVCEDRAERPEDNTKLHLYCAVRLFKDQTNPKCPKCKHDWEHQIPRQA
ncbi:unnamed protein product [Owenia fusiformis]|uniref:Non-structural maintenance of chromosomes element 1 homolog n=1 Tax=Owenia fusiformis TaxID=6347 RepID=A0A8J1U8I2_OWEFU|nr:unnamed protein product [Owenia fusiformis]